MNGSMFINEELSNPFGLLEYDIFTIEHCQVTIDTLNSIFEQYDVMEDTYKENGHIKNYSDGFLERFLEFITEDYLNIVLKYNNTNK